MVTNSFKIKSSKNFSLYTRLLLLDIRLKRRQALRYPILLKKRFFTKKKNARRSVSYI